MKQKITTKKIVMTALLAALTVVGSMLRIKVPSIVGTSAFHLGNIMCALSGLLLGPWFGGLAAGLGSAIYDMMDPVYISECWITFIMKGAYGLVVGLIAWSGKKPWNTTVKIAGNGKNPWNTTVKMFYPKALVAAIAGALTYALLYLSKTFFYGGLLVKGLTPDAAFVATLEKIAPTTFNAVVAVIAAPLLAVAISKGLEKAHLSL